MSRNIEEIQQTILDAKDASLALSALQITTTQEQSLNDINSNSKVAIWRLWVWIFAFAQKVQEQYWDAFKVEIEKRIAESRIHTRKWYREKALEFLYGVALVPEKDYYDLSQLTDAQIKAAKIVSNAASVRVIQNGAGTLRIKVVRTLDNEYAPLLPEQLAPLNTYFNEHIADAGTLVFVSTGEADLLKIKLDIYYDPLILGADGSRLDGTNFTPVVTQIKDFLKSIDFENGKLIITHLTDKLQQIEGVVLPVVRESYSKYGAYDYTTTDVQNVGLINEIRIADAGYMKLDENELLINYIPFVE